MVNGLHLYSAFIQSALQFFASHSPIHTHIHTPTAIGCHARYQPARQEQLGVRCLAQGHFDTPRVGSNRQPSDCQTTALPPEPHRPQYSHKMCIYICVGVGIFNSNKYLYCHFMYIILIWISVFCLHIKEVGFFTNSHFNCYVVIIQELG